MIIKKSTIKVIKNGVDISKSKATDTKKLREYANNLNINLPKSEQWFKVLYEPFRNKILLPVKIGYLAKKPRTITSDSYNKPFHGFIPDVLNNRFKYIIEVDGSIHNNLEVKEKDFAKQALYKNLGYKVFRVKAFDYNSFKQFKKDYLKYINSCNR